MFIISLYKLYRKKKEQECEAFLGFVCFFTFKIECYSQAFVTLLVFLFLWDCASTLRSGGGTHSPVSDAEVVTHFVFFLLNLANVEINFFLLWDFSLDSSCRLLSRIFTVEKNP